MRLRLGLCPGPRWGAYSAIRHKPEMVLRGLEAAGKWRKEAEGRGKDVG